MNAAYSEGAIGIALYGQALEIFFEECGERRGSRGCL